MDRLRLAIVIGIVGALLAVGLLWVGEDGDSGEECVAANCCHATGCVWESEAPDCGDIFCSMSCEPGTMDCGQGHCEAVNEKCEIVWDE